MPITTKSSSEELTETLSLSFSLLQNDSKPITQGYRIKCTTLFIDHNTREGSWDVLTQASPKPVTHIIHILIQCPFGLYFCVVGVFNLLATQIAICELSHYQVS